MQKREPHELELLQFMREKWQYGGTVAQITAAYGMGPDVPVDHLLVLLMFAGDVREEGDLYFPN